MLEDPGIAMGWMEPLREYPRWLVLGCAAVLAGGWLVVLAKFSKWAIYLGMAGLLVGLMGWLAWWLEQ